MSAYRDVDRFNEYLEKATSPLGCGLVPHEIQWMFRTGGPSLVAQIESDAKVIAALREALATARDDLERVAVDGDDFDDTIAKIDAALMTTNEQTAVESK